MCARACGWGKGGSRAYLLEGAEDLDRDLRIGLGVGVAKVDLRRVAASTSNGERNGSALHRQVSVLEATVSETMAFGSSKKIKADRTSLSDNNLS